MIKGITLLLILAMATAQITDIPAKESSLRTPNTQLAKKFGIIKSELKLTSVSHEVIRCINGFLTTVGFYGELPSIQKCLDDLLVIEYAIDVITSALTGNYYGIASAIYSLTKEAWTIFYNCNYRNLAPEIAQASKDFWAIVSQDKYIEKVVAGIQNNMLQLMADLQKAFSAFTSGNLEEFGRTLGLIINIILNPK